MNFTKVRRSKARKMSTRDRQLRDWQQKSDYLSNHYIGVAPLTFYVSLGFADVSDEFSLCTMNAKAPAGQRMKKYCDIIDMLADSYGRDDAYVYPAFYLNSYPKEILLHSLRCLYLDLDYVTAASLRRLCEHDFYGHRPTFLVNSGNGVHLVYVLSDSLTTCRETKEQLSTIHRKLLQAFAKHRFKADMNTGLSHAYRVVSSKTKLGQRCTAYRIGGTHDIADLAASVGMVWNDTNPSYYKSEQTYEKNAVRKSQQNQESARCRQNPHALYDCMLRGIEEKTVEGHRYTSLFALTCAGYKCHVSMKKVRQDVLYLANRLHLPLYEAEHALEACDEKKALTVRAVTLESWLGWKFARAKKRNGRTRQEHLAWVAEVRTAISRSRVWQYLQSDPQASIAGIARKLHMGRNTVAKYVREKWQQIAAEAAAAVREAVNLMEEELEKETASTLLQSARKLPASFIPSIRAPWGELCSASSAGEAKREAPRRNLLSPVVSLT